MSTNDKPNVDGKKAIIGISAIAVIFFVYNFFQKKTDNQEVSTPVPIATTHQEDLVNGIGNVDRDASLTQFSKQLDSLRQENNRTKEQLINLAEESKKEKRELQQELNSEIRKLSEKLAEADKTSMDGSYLNANAADAGKKLDLPSSPGETNVEGLNFDDFNLGTPNLNETPSQRTSGDPYGPNYFILRPQTTAVQGPKSGGGASVNQNGSDTFVDVTGPDTNGFDRASTNTDNKMTQAFDEMHGRTPSQQNSLPPEDNLKFGVGVSKEREAYVVPAFSYVEVTTLHGVACPIGASQPGAQSKIPARPVVLPVHGIFKGPNNVERDLGTIHLMGLCSGNRTSSSSTGRATIKIERLSYWDEEGGSQYVPVSGYIVDKRDNEQDVFGRLDETSGKVLAMQSAAAAAAAYATTLSQAEFTNQQSIGDGNVNTTQTLTGDANKAAAQQGIAAMFTKIAERFEAEANAAVDTVIVEPGIKLQFVSDTPFQVLKPSEPFEIDPDAYDVLI